MASKRMFRIDLVTSDAFLDMPLTAQGLFFHLCIRADDDGFVDCANKTVRECQASKEDLKILIDKHYVLTFPGSNVIVIKHWKLHNCIQKDRYKPTNYAEEKAMLYTKRNGAYTFDSSKNFSGLNAIRSAGSSPGKEAEACIPSLAEVADYCRERKNGVIAEAFIDYYKSIGWKRNGEIITDWKAALRSWEKQEKESNPRSKNKFNNFHQRSYDYDELEKTLAETNVMEGRDKK